MNDLLSLSTQKYPEVFQAHQAYVASFLSYMLSVFWWHRISFLEEKQGVIKMSMKDKFFILLEVVNKPNIHMIWNWEWFQKIDYRNDSDDLQKDLGNSCLHGHASKQEFLWHIVCTLLNVVSISENFRMWSSTEVCIVQYANIYTYHK